MEHTKSHFTAFIFSRRKRQYHSVMKNREKKSNRFINTTCCDPADVDVAGSLKTVPSKDGFTRKLMLARDAHHQQVVIVEKRNEREVPRVLKAVLFETSLAMQIRSKRTGISSFRSSNYESSSNLIHHPNNDNRRTSSSISSLSRKATSIATSLGPSIVSSSRTMSEHGLSVLLVILLALLLWGKVCAIVCTSTCLFFVPRWSTGQRSASMSLLAQG